MIGKTPRDHGLVDPTFADTPLFAGLRSADASVDGKLSRATGQPAADDASGCPLEKERRERGSLPRVDEFVFFFIPPFFTPMPHWQEETLCSIRKSERVKLYAVVPFEIPHKEGGQKKSIALKVW